MRVGSLRDRCFDFARYGDRVVLEDDSGTLRAGELAVAIDRGAAALVRHGVRPGDRVAWLGPTAIDTVIGVLAVQATGAIAVPLCPRHTTGELQHVIDDSDSAVLVAHPSMHDRLVACAGARRLLPSPEITGAPALAAALPRLDIDDEHPALLIYTSGTTGPSKGVALSWRALVSNMYALGSLWGLGPHDTCSLMLPLFHVHGLCIGVYAMLLAGATTHLHPKLDTAALVTDIRDGGATVWLAVPTMYVALLEHVARVPTDADVLRRARLFTAGSAPLSPATHAAFEAATGHVILERYGMTETLVTLSNPLVGERQPGSVGMPVPGVEIRIVGDDGDTARPGEPGELRVRGDSLMTGYWRNPEATAAAFDGDWFRTGDVAVQDDDGRVIIVGRSSTDIIKSGGFKISTREIEDVLLSDPRVVDAAVLGVTDSKWGERVVAAITVRGEAPLDEITVALAVLCRARLADYKCPRQWIVRDDLPRNAMGKVDKRGLRAAIEQDYGGDVDLRRSQMK